MVNLSYFLLQMNGDYRVLSTESLGATFKNYVKHNNNLRKKTLFSHFNNLQSLSSTLDTINGVRQITPGTLQIMSQSVPNRQDPKIKWYGCSIFQSDNDKVGTTTFCTQRTQSLLHVIMNNVILRPRSHTNITKWNKE